MKWVLILIWDYRYAVRWRYNLAFVFREILRARRWRWPKERCNKLCKQIENRKFSTPIIISSFHGRTKYNWWVNWKCMFINFSLIQILNLLIKYFLFRCLLRWTQQSTWKKEKDLQLFKINLSNWWKNRNSRNRLQQ